MSKWAILSGEYPPRPGGVADYTRQICEALTKSGEKVSVYAAFLSDRVKNKIPPELVALPDNFGFRGISYINNTLRTQKPDFILIQYVPHAYGMKAMNLPFAIWVAFRARRIAPVWIMFHEVSFPFVRRPLHHNILAVVNRLMARLLCSAADRIFVSIPAWADLLHKICPRLPPTEWLPVPSNIPAASETKNVSEIRSSITQDSNICIVGHFGTFGSNSAPTLLKLFSAILRKSPNRIARLIGRNSDRFLTQFSLENPDLKSRISASGGLTSEVLAAELKSCDLLVQTYHDGVSTRRGSLMAGLALGVPIVTNLGTNSESIWGTDSPGVSVTRTSDNEDICIAVDELLALSPSERAARGHAAAEWYQSRFSIEMTVKRIRSAAMRDRA